jgi:hypothetical protein
MTMKLDLTNTGSVPVPVTGHGWGQVLQPGQMSTLDYPDGVWLVGDKDNVVENIGKSIKAIANFIRGKKRPAPGDAITVSIVNAGSNAVRVVPGNVQTESVVQPLATATLSGTDYIELRELDASWNPVENPIHGGGTPN